MYDQKKNLIEDLTGIKSSKKNYYIELKKKNLQTQKQNTQLEIINKLAKSINVNTSIQEMMESVAEKLRQVLSFEFMELNLLEGEDLNTRVSLPEKDVGGLECTRCSVEDRNSLFWKSVAEKRSFLRTKFSVKNHEYCEEQVLAQLGIRALIVVPLVTKEKVIGVLTICSGHEEGFTKLDLVFGEQLADQLAVCIENAQLYDELKKKLAIEAQVRQSAKLAAIGEMAAGIAHELNSPLTAILGDAQLLKRKAKSENNIEFKLATDIVNSGIRCKKIIEGLLTFSRQDQQPFTMVHMNIIVDRALNLIRYQVDSNNVRLLVELDKELPRIEGSSQQLEQVLINLILNAKDAVSHRQGGEIRLRTGMKHHASMGKCVTTSVTDNGIGISEELLTDIFNPFYTTKPPGQGTGLGLSVTMGIIEAHGGKIHVESKEGEGSTFIVYIPVKEGGESYGQA
ncbi:signal transduction histidine kinase [Desulfitispora alkaliphila]|uniref:ATP-binding protein n=1 Tax=Desulfitispora alkaliphila TaxID=622674 RepID=UPI003D229E6A